MALSSKPGFTFRAESYQSGADGRTKAVPSEVLVTFTPPLLYIEQADGSRPTPFAYRSSADLGGVVSILLPLGSDCTPPDPEIELVLTYSDGSEKVARGIVDDAMKDQIGGFYELDTLWGWDVGITTLPSDPHVWVIGPKGDPGSAADVSAEATARADADTAEAAARAAAISAEASTRASADTTEATARVAGDATTATAISVETAARQSAITSEATTRAAADSTEATARSTADTAEATARAAAITTEATTRAAADLAEQINRLTGEAVSTTFDVGGTITDTYSPSGLVVVTTFGVGTITAVYGAPVNKTKTTTFNGDGSISEVIA